MRQITLGSHKYPGLVALVDDGDHEWLSRFRWTASRKGRRTFRFYAVTAIEGRNVYLHRLIMGADPGVEIDHIDRNPLNNQRSNLRVATRAQQSRNTVRHNRRGRSGPYKGVSWHKQGQKWQAHIYREGQRYYLGLFANPAAAARAYDAKARELYGEDALLNFPARGKVS